MVGAIIINMIMEVSQVMVMEVSQARSITCLVRVARVAKAREARARRRSKKFDQRVAIVGAMDGGVVVSSQFSVTKARFLFDVIMMRYV